MDDITAMIVRALGATGGAFLALVFQPPTSIRDFAIRGAFSFFSGALFGEPMRDQYLHWPASWQMVLASSALVALGSWWIWGAVVRVVNAWKPK